MTDQTLDVEQAINDPDDGHTDPGCPAAEAQAFAPMAAAARPWRTARALEQLRSQVNAAWPGRNKENDGTIGDAAHQSRASDHNPWVVDGASGVVTAMDITNDPAHGCDASAIVAALVASRDRRIKYLIWNRRIANASAIGPVPAWTWRTYTGASPHDHHFHLSVKPDKALFDDTSPWAFRHVGAAAFAGGEAAGAGGDPDAEALNALAALGAGVDPHGSPLPQLLAVRDNVEALLSIYGSGWAPAQDEGGQAFAAAARPDFASLKPGYEHLFATAKVLDKWKSTVGWYLGRLRNGRKRYEEVEHKTGAPWWFVGIVHGMEASFDFAGHLHNGDPLTARTVQVPKNRPKVWNPPNDWLSSAVDALDYEGFLNQKDWSLARALYRFEGYNGYGYYARHINSPYLWSFSNQYSKGKFVGDHQYSPDAVSKQCGAAVMLRALADAGDIPMPS